MEEIIGPQMYWGGWTKEGGGVKTLSPSPLPRTSPNRQYARVKYGAGARKFTKITYHLTREGGVGGSSSSPPPPTNHRTTCKDKIKIWARLTKKHILQSIITTDSHILGGADRTQTWSNDESCAKMFAGMSKRLHNVREKLIKMLRTQKVVIYCTKMFAKMYKY